MSEHRRHICPEDDLDLVCNPDYPWCEECMERWPCGGAGPTRTDDGQIMSLLL